MICTPQPANLLKTTKVCQVLDLLLWMCHKAEFILFYSENTELFKPLEASCDLCYWAIEIKLI